MSIADLLVVPQGETSKQKIDRWFEIIRRVEAGLRAGETFTEEEMDWYYFVREKIDDWNSDWGP
jgi:hypothetical protein